MKTPSPFCLCLVVLCSSSASFLAAQTASDPGAAGQSDTTVTLSPFVVASENQEGYGSQRTLAGTRVAADLLDLSSPITIISRQLIDDLNASDIQHVLGYGVSGVTANQTTYDDVYIRGFRAGKSMREGIAVASYAPSPMFDIERVEVIKGPLALVLGDNAFLGGALNFIPRAPTAHQMGDVALSYDSYVDGKQSFRYTVNDSGPVYKSQELTVLFRATVGGIDGKASKEIENHDQKFFGGALQFNFGSNTSLSIDAFRYLNNDRWGYDDFLDNRYTTVAVLNPNSTAKFSPGLGQDDPQRQRTTNINVNFLTKLTKNSSVRLAYGYNGFGYYSGNLAGDHLAADNYTLTPAYTRYDERDTTDVLQADYLHRLTLDPLTNDFSAGGDYRVITSWAGEGPYTLLPAIDTRNPDYSGERARAPQIAADFNSGLFASNYEVQARQTQTTYYVQDSISFLKDRIIVVGGLRWFQNRATNANYVANTFSETNQPGLSVHRYGAIVKPLPWVSLYYMNATNEIPVVGFDNEDVPKPFHNQVGKDSEFGVKFDNKKLTQNLSVYGSAAIFDMALTNIKENSGQLNSAGRIILLQTAKNTNKGWEFDTGTRYTYEYGAIDAIVTCYHGDALGVDNTHARAVPNNTFSLLLKHTWTSGVLKRVMVGGGTHQTGVKFANGYRIYTPDLYDLFGGYGINKNWKVQLDWYNVGDKRYVTAFGSAALVMTGMPGTVSLSTRYQF